LIVSRLVVPDGCANTIPVVIQAAVKSDPDINKIFGFIDFSFSDFDIRSSDVMLFFDRFIPRSIFGIFKSAGLRNQQIDVILRTTEGRN